MDHTQQTVVRSGSPFEVLALAEGTLGFEPRESLVLVSLRPPRWRTGLVARVDLPSPADAGRVAQVLAQHVAADGAGRCFVAVVTDAGGVPRPRRTDRSPARRSDRRSDRRAGRRADPPAGRGGDQRWQLPRTVLVEQVARALEDLDVEPEPWLVHRGRLYSYACQGPCCPPEGLSMERVRSTQVAAELVLDGRVLGLDRQQWDGALRAAVEPAGEEVLQAVEDALARVEATTEAQEPIAALTTWRSLVTADAGSLEQRLDPPTCAVILDALTRIPLRDVLLGTLVPEALPPCSEGCAAGSTGGSTDGPTCGVCWSSGRDPRSAVLGRPDVEVAVRVLQLLAQRTRPGRRAVPLGCAAYLLWSSGSGPQAGRHAEMALAEDPSHTLSDLVLRSVELGVPPPHVVRRRGGGGGSPGRPHGEMK